MKDQEARTTRALVPETPRRAHAPLPPSPTNPWARRTIPQIIRSSPANNNDNTIIPTTTYRSLLVRRHPAAHHGRALHGHLGEVLAAGWVHRERQRLPVDDQRSLTAPLEGYLPPTLAGVAIDGAPAALPARLLKRVFVLKGWARYGGSRRGGYVGGDGGGGGGDAVSLIEWVGIRVRLFYGVIVAGAGRDVWWCAIVQWC